MSHIVGKTAGAQPINASRRANLERVSVGNSGAAEMLQGCPVVTASGEVIGTVENLIIDVRTQQLRYVVVVPARRRSPEIAIPWKTLYFDSAMARLVFYTWT